MARCFYFQIAMLALVTSHVVAAESRSGLVLDRKEGQLEHYRGTVVVEGVAERRTDKETLEIQGDNLCFVVSGASRRFIPRGKGDTRLPWFCFSERKAAASALKLPNQSPKGSCGYRMPATVVIGKYVVNRKESAVADTAALIEVRARGPVTPIPCQ